MDWAALEVPRLVLERKYNPTSVLFFSFIHQLDAHKLLHSLLPDYTVVAVEPLDLVSIFFVLQH